MGELGHSDVNAQIASTEIGLNVQDSTPPTQTYVGKDDSIWVGAATQNVGLIVTLNARFLMPNGSIQLNQYTLRFPQSRQMSYQQVFLPECFLLSLSATPNTQAGSPSSTFIAVMLSRFAPTLFNASLLLCSGYSTANQPVSWPGGINSTSVDCAGAIVTSGTSAPAAGVNFSITVPANAKWRPIALNCTLTASAAVANRGLVVTLDDGSNLFATGANPTVVTASQVATLCVAASPELQSAPILVFPINLFAGVLLFPGFRIRSAIQNLQVGDQISAVSLLVEEWILP